jgi:K+ transporter
MNLFLEIIQAFFIAYWPMIIAIVSTILSLFIFLRGHKKSRDNKTVLDSLMINKIFNESDLELELNSIFISMDKKETTRKDQDLILVDQVSEELNNIINIKREKEPEINGIDIYLDSEALESTMINKLALIWIGFWVGFLCFITARICFHFLVFNCDGILIPYFIYYILLGYIVFEKSKRINGKEK